MDPSQGASLPTRRITDEEIARLEEATRARVSAKIAEGSRGTKLHKLGLALSLLDLLEANDLGTDRNQSLGRVDAGARDVLGMRASQLRRLADELMTSKEVKNAFARASDEAKSDVFGPGHREVVRSYSNYLIGPFLHTLPTEPVPRSKLIEAQLRKLTVLDVDVAQETAGAFLALEIVTQPAAIIRRLAPVELVDAIARSLSTIASMLLDATTPPEIEHGKTLGRSAAAETVYGTWNAVRGMKLGDSVAKLLQDAAGRAQIARALGQAMTQRSCHSLVSDPNEARQLRQWLRNHGHDGAAKFLRRIDLGTQGGRGLAAFSSLVALCGVFTMFPPVDARGRVNWVTAGWIAGTGASVGSSLPTLAQFSRQDVTRWANTLVRKEIFDARKAVVTGRAIRAAKFARICKFLGPVGDSLTVAVAGWLIVHETRNEDPLAAICRGVQAGSSVLALVAFAVSLGSTGFGLPLAAIATVAGLGASVINIIWGESEMTGQVRQDLRYLGITDHEDEIQRRLATRMVSVPAPNKQTMRVARPLSRPQVRANAKAATVHQKQALINAYMDGYTSGGEETLIYQILSDARDEGQFLQLIESLDTKVLARELENDKQAADVLCWILAAYGVAGRPPTSKFGDFLEDLAYEHRENAIMKMAQAMTPVETRTYQRHDPVSIRRATEKLMDGATNGREQGAIMSLLDAASDPQFDKIMAGGGERYIAFLHMKMQGHWPRIHGRMMLPQSSHTVRKVAVNYSPSTISIASVAG